MNANATSYLTGLCLLRITVSMTAWWTAWQKEDEPTTVVANNTVSAAADNQLRMNAVTAEH